MRSTKGLCVQMLGGFSIMYNGMPLSFGKGNARPFLQLLQILLLHRDTGISKERLMEIFYSCSEVGNKNNSLNNLIYRLRKRLTEAGLPEEEYVSVYNGICRWNSKIPLWVDVLEVEAAVSRAGQAVTEEDKKQALLQVHELYRGVLLPQLSSESWVIVEGLRLKKMYDAAISELCEILERQKEYGQAYRIYSDAAAVYPYEEWQIGQMESLIGMERYEEAYRLYYATVNLYMEELDVPPSQRMLDCIQKMRDRMMLPEENLERIQENLREAPATEAYYCAYPGFIDTYRVLCRLTRRNGQSVFLMSCTIGQFQSEKEKKNSSQIRKWLRTAICSSLRSGDLCTQYSRTQFLILLTGMKREDGEVITARIRRKFEQKGGAEGYFLTFALVSAVDAW